jgi:hypothetical protein
MNGLDNRADTRRNGIAAVLPSGIAISMPIFLMLLNVNLLFNKR